MRAILCFLIFVAVVCAGLSGEISKSFTKPGGHAAVAAASPPRDASPTQISTGGRTVRLEGDRHGQFRVDARIDGRTVGYSGDTTLCPGLREIAASADALVMECNSHHDVSPVHLTFDDVRTIRADPPTRGVASFIYRQTPTISSQSWLRRIWTVA